MKLYTVRKEALIQEAESIERIAKESLKAWAILGQSHKYSDLMQQAYTVRRAAETKSIHVRREMLRNLGYTFATLG